MTKIVDNNELRNQTTAALAAIQGRKSVPAGIIASLARTVNALPPPPTFRASRLLLNELLLQLQTQGGGGRTNEDTKCISDLNYYNNKLLTIPYQTQTLITLAQLAWQQSGIIGGGDGLGLFHAPTSQTIGIPSEDVERLTSRKGRPRKGLPAARPEKAAAFILVSLRDLTELATGRTDSHYREAVKNALNGLFQPQLLPDGTTARLIAFWGKGERNSGTTYIISLHPLITFGNTANYAAFPSDWSKRIAAAQSGRGRFNTDGATRLMSYCAYRNSTKKATRIDKTLTEIAQIIGVTQTLRKDKARTIAQIIEPAFALCQKIGAITEFSKETRGRAIIWHFFANPNFRLPEGGSHPSN